MVENFEELDTILKLIEEKKFFKLRETLTEMNPADIATIFDEVNQKDITLLFRVLPKELAADTFTYLEPEMQQNLIEAFSDRELSDVIDELFMDDTVDIIEEMPANVVNKILKNVLDITNQESDIISQFIYKIMINRESHPNYLLFETTNNQTTQEALKQLILESHIHQDKYSSKIALSWFKIFMYNILRDFNSTSLYLPIEDTYKTLYAILNYIENNYDHISLSDLSKEFHYNEAYLSSLIKKTFNISFSSILTNIKMTHAKAYLLNTDMKLDEISIKIGYNSVDHFIRTFTRLNGTTPGKYRKQYSNN